MNIIPMSPSPIFHKALGQLISGWIIPQKSDERLNDHQNGTWYSPNSAALPRFQNAYSVTIAGGGKS